MITLLATKKSIELLINIKDSDWQKDIDGIINLGMSRIKSSKNLDDLFASVSATYIYISFLQIGFFPYRQNSTPHESYWKLDKYRTVQYIQNEKQKEHLEILNQKRRVSSKLNSE